MWLFSNVGLDLNRTADFGVPIEFYAQESNRNSSSAIVVSGAAYNYSKERYYRYICMLFYIKYVLNGRFSL